MSDKEQSDHRALGVGVGIGVGVLAQLLAACGGEVTRSAAAADPPVVPTVSVAESDRAVLGEPDVRLEPVSCPTGVPSGLRSYVNDGASLEYKGCWTGGPTGDLAVGVLDADGVPPEAELGGLYAFANRPNSSELRLIGGGPPGFPLAEGDAAVVELRGLASTGVVVAVPAIAGWADLPEMPEIREADGTIGSPTWVEIVTLDADGVILNEYAE